MKRHLLALALLALAPGHARAQAVSNAQVLPGGCGTAALGQGVNTPTMDPQGRLCGSPGTITATGALAIPGADNTTEALVGWVPGNTNPVEIPTLLPGIFGAGATFLCNSAASTNVDCNFVAKSAGNLNFGNGSGMFHQELDPGDSPSATYSYTPGTLSATVPNQIVIAAVARQAAPSTHWQLTTNSGGWAIGVSGKAIGSGSVALGAFSQTFGSGSMVSGTSAYDWSSTGLRCHQSASAPAATTGGNEVCEQTLWRTIPSTAALRLTVDGGSGVTQGQTVPLQTNGHGSYRLDVECTDTTTGDLAGWVVTGNFVRVAAALRLLNQTGDGTAPSTAGVLTTASLAVTADTTNNNLSVIVTPPAANAHNLACDAAARWMQRIL